MLLLISDVNLDDMTYPFQPQEFWTAEIGALRSIGRASVLVVQTGGLAKEAVEQPHAVHGVQETGALSSSHATTAGRCLFIRFYQKVIVLGQSVHEDYDEVVGHGVS